MYKTRLLAALIALISAHAYASGGTSATAPTNAKWKAECASCHIAYPARMLPADSWKRLMRGLNNHFGEDASLNPADTAEILAFLEKNASRRKVEPAPQPAIRITEMQWFIHEHEEVANRLWKDPRVKSASNCAACHTNAENGRFSERELRVPK